MGWPGGISATTSRIALAPMSTTAMGRGASAGGGTAGGGGHGLRQRPLAGGHQDAGPRAQACGAREGRDGRRRRDLDLHPRAQHPRQQLRLPRHAPHLEGGIAAHVGLHEQRVAAGLDREPLHHLVVAAVERIGQPQKRGQHLHRPAVGPRQSRERGVLLPRAAAVVPGDVREHLHLQRREAAEVAVLDEVVGVLVVAPVRDVVPDPVEEGGVLEQRAMDRAQAVPPDGGVEQVQRELGDLARVFLVVAAALGQADHAALADVGVGLRPRHRPRVLVDVVEQDPLAQRPLAQHQLPRAEALQDGVEEDRAGHDDVRPRLVEAGDLQARLHVGGGDPLPEGVDLVGGHRGVVQGVRHLAPALEGERAQGEDRPRRADHGVEPGGADALHVGLQHLVEMLHEPGVVAGGERIGPDEVLGEAQHADLLGDAQLQGVPAPQRQLDAAAADVHHQRAPPLEVDAVEGGQVDEPRLLVAGDRARPDVELAADRLQEVLAVPGLAHGRGGHGEHLVRPRALAPGACTCGARPPRASWPRRRGGRGRGCAPRGAPSPSRGRSPGRCRPGRCRRGPCAASCCRGRWRRCAFAAPLYCGAS